MQRPNDLFEKDLRKQGYQFIAGVDEAGRGPLAGPVVAAACILPLDLPISEIQDSKKISEKVREKVFLELTEVIQIPFGIGIVGSEEIDEINILQATFLAMQRAISNLDGIVDFALIDGNRSPKLKIPSQTIISGDSKSVSIAASSILAKVTRDRMMKEFGQKWPEYGFEKHKGYGTSSHMEALSQYGPSPIHRKTFAPVMKYLKEANALRKP